jgi:DNA-binding MarR family transcriptional regulator
MATIDAARTWSLSYRLLGAVISGVAPAVSALGLEIKELFVLAEIDEHPHPAALAEALSMPKPSISVYLKHLEAAGHVRRAIDADDLRRHRLMVTAAGRKVLRRGLSAVSDAFRARLDRLTPAEQAELQRLLQKMG